MTGLEGDLFYSVVEYFYSVAEYFREKAHFMRGYPWVKFYTAALQDLAFIPSSALLVFFEMVKVSKPGGFAYLTYRHLQKRTKLSQPAVSKAVGILIDRQFIERRDKNAYRLNPRYVAIGSRRLYTPKLPGLVDTNTGAIKLFKRTGEAK